MQPLGPSYDPPYDSPIEEVFAHNAVKYLAEDARFDKQVDVPTICGTYRLNFLVGRAGRRLAVECDGREFHDEHRDEWRDALILGAGAADVIYRFRGCDLTYHVEDLLFLMADADPHYFSERGRLNLGRLASDEARAHAGQDPSPSAIVAYRSDPDQRHGGVRHVYVRRWLRVERPGRRALWWDWFRHAKRFAPRCHGIEGLMAMHQASLAEPEAKRPTEAEPCERCRRTIERRDVKAVWVGQVVCRACYAELYRSSGVDR